MITKIYSNLKKRKKIFLKALVMVQFFLYCSPNLLFSQAKPRIAVMPFTSGSGISKPEARYITNRVRTALIKTRYFDVISNDQLKTMLKTKAMKQKIGRGSCSTKQCIIDLGNALECEKMIIGSAESAFGEYIISVKLLDVVNQKYEKAEDIRIKNKSKFPDAAVKIVNLLFGGGDTKYGIYGINKESTVGTNKSSFQELNLPTKINSNGFALEVGYGNAFSGLGVVGEYFIRMSGGHFSLLAGVGYFPSITIEGIQTEPSGGADIGLRLNFGSYESRFVLEYTYGFVGVQAGTVYVNGTQESFKQENLIGHSFSVGYGYLSSEGFIFIATIGLSKAETDYFGELTVPTLNLGIGYKFD